MNKTRKIKQKRKAKDKCLETETLEGVCYFHKEKRQTCLLYLQQKGNRVRIALRPLYPKISWWTGTLFPRTKLPRSMLQLQYKPIRKPMGIWKEIRGRNSDRTLQIKKPNTKSR